MDTSFLPDPSKDQFFLSDPKIIKKIVDLADLKPTDVVLEIGAGTGNLTKELAKKAGQVIVFEIDSRFKPVLSTLPPNVKLHFEDAWDYIQLHGKFRKKKVYNKVVSCPPYSLCEPLLHNLTFLDYDKVILLVPKKFLRTIKENAIFSSFFKFKNCLDVPKTNFDPQPKTNSAIIDLLKLPDPITHPNLPLFLKQYVYQHEGQKVKNSLTEGLIHFYHLTQNKKITKNQARQIITKTAFPQSLLESLPATFSVYEQIDQNFQD
jgi:16S rRNA (adenine1518-N6/adenine1519-N6)-dimethyltransferase